MLDSDFLDLARYEIKFVSEQSNFYHFKNWLMLNPMGFSSQHPPRIINNIYFDNIECDSYWENLTGCSSRSKIRLRWYGEEKDVNEATLEIKSKRNRLGFKYSQKIKFSKPILNLNFQTIRNIIKEQLHGDAQLRFSLSDSPILGNRYYREYFVGQDNTIRVTVDKELNFFDQRDKVKPNFRFHSLVPEITILEVKTPATKIDLAEKMLARIELAPSKSSKYVIGVQSLLGFQ